MTTEITSIELSGFQVFESLTTIPLKRITLLYGPNSAGKSAVEDAIQLSMDFLNQSFETVDKRYPRLWRHWRRTGDRAENLAKTMQLNISLRTDRHLPLLLQHYFEEKYRWGEEEFKVEKESGGSRELKVEYTFKLVDPKEWGVIYGDHPVFRKIDVALDGKALLSFEEAGYLEINLQHPFIRQTRFLSDFEDSGEVENGFDFLKISDGKLRTNTTCAFEGEIDWDVEGVNEGLNKAQEWARDRLLVFLEGMMNAIKTLSSDLHCSTAPASRKIPTTEDVIYFVSSQGKVSMLDQIGLHDSGDPAYRKLTLSISADISKRDDTFGKQVNRYLTDYLFSEKGYLLSYEAIKTTPTSLPQSLLPVPQSESNGFDGVIRLVLKDPQFRTFQFSEVGSGLGYVLPVLAALGRDMAAIQQPELHLHPALQSELADVFIDATREDIHGTRKLIIETHSEHILLRLLRRIRQSHEGKVRSPELFIEADDVNVLYFNPEADDTTSVKELRISHTGDFLDRWPRGFFAERDKELFDDE